jgi:hypothetical protein
MNSFPQNIQKRFKRSLALKYSFDVNEASLSKKNLKHNPTNGSPLGRTGRIARNQHGGWGFHGREPVVGPGRKGKFA